MKLNVLAFVASIFLCVAASARDYPTIDPGTFTSLYGKPDAVKSTEYDKPRPPFVTRMYEYRRAGIRVILLPNAPMGSPPPYREWKLMGYQDMKSEKVVPEAEAKSRLTSAKRR